jgi:hypothetical protein
MQTIAWQPQIGDPTFAGWFTVFSYILAAYLSFRVYRDLPKLHHPHHKQRLFWLAIGLLSLVLGFNKQLDLQSLLTSIGKYYAYQQGWYQQRRLVQMSFIGMILIFGMGFIVWGIHFFKGILIRNWLAFTGIIFLIIFILLRATSFHHMDQLIGFRLMGLKLNWILELTGIYSIVFNALWILRPKK